MEGEAGSPSEICKHRMRISMRSRCGLHDSSRRMETFQAGDSGGQSSRCLLPAGWPFARRFDRMAKKRILRLESPNNRGGQNGEQVLISGKQRARKTLRLTLRNMGRRRAAAAMSSSSLSTQEATRSEVLNHLSPSRAARSMACSSAWESDLLPDSKCCYFGCPREHLQCSITSGDETQKRWPRLELQRISWR